MDLKFQSQPQNHQVLHKHLRCQNSVQLRDSNNNQDERLQRDRHHEQKRFRLNRQTNNKINHTSNQNTTLEEVNKTEEIKVIEETEETDHIVEEISNVIRNQAKASEANKALALIEQTIEHYEAKNGHHQDQAAQEAIKAEIHQEHNVRELEVKPEQENLSLVHIVEK